MVTGNSEGVGDLKSQNFRKKSMKLNRNFWRGEGFKCKKTTVHGGGMDIFWNNTLYFTSSEVNMSNSLNLLCKQMTSVYLQVPQVQILLSLWFATVHADVAMSDQLVYSSLVLLS